MKKADIEEELLRNLRFPGLWRYHAERAHRAAEIIWAAYMDAQLEAGSKGLHDYMKDVESTTNKHWTLSLKPIILMLMGLTLECAAKALYLQVHTTEAKNWSLKTI